jgi:hypothetical protein
VSIGNQFSEPKALVSYGEPTVTDIFGCQRKGIYSINLSYSHTYSYSQTHIVIVREGERGLCYVYGMFMLVCYDVVYGMVYD